MRTTGATVTFCGTRRKNVLEIGLHSSSAQETLLIDVTPSNPAMFLDWKTERQGFVTLFPVLEGTHVASVQIADDDRIVDILFSAGKILRVYLFGSSANVILLEQDVAIASFKKREKPVLQTGTGSKVRQLPTALQPGGRFQVNQVEAAVKQALQNPVFRLLDTGEATVFSEGFYPEGTKATFDSALNLVRSAYRNEVAAERFEMLQRDLHVRISTQIRKLVRRIAEETDESALLSKAEAARRFADSLLASAHLSPTEGNILVFPDVYDSSAMLRVVMPRGKNSRDIAHDYYGRAKRLEMRAKASKVAKECFEKKLEELNELQAQLSSVTGLKDLERLSKRFDSSAVEAGKKVLPGVAVHHVEGFEVWVGKSAAGNDLILQKSHKDDIWMHARSVAGAHVLIRMQRKNGDPPVGVLEKAASWAAWRSKSRGAALVPVQWTYRKFVRKPKGAASGMVIVQREHVLMVAPSADPDQNDLT